MRRWFELGELADTTYADSAGDRIFLQLPQKADFIEWANSMVGVFARLTTGTGDSGVCVGVSPTPGDPHLITPPPDVNLISQYGELRGLVLFQGIPPVYKGLCRNYFDKPGINDGPNDQGVQPKATPTVTGKGPKGHETLSLALYLTLLWQTYLAEHKYVVANQVLTELNLLQNGKVTTVQVLDFLSKLPPTQ